MRSPFAVRLSLEMLPLMFRCTSFSGYQIVIVPCCHMMLALLLSYTTEVWSIADILSADRLLFLALLLNQVRSSIFPHLNSKNNLILPYLYI